MVQCAEFSYELDGEDLVIRIPLNQNRNRPSKSLRTILIASSKGRKFVVDNDGKERPEYFNFSCMMDRVESEDGETYDR